MANVRRELGTLRVVLRRIIFWNVNVEAAVFAEVAEVSTTAILAEPNLEALSELPEVGAFLVTFARVAPEIRGRSELTREIPMIRNFTPMSLKRWRSAQRFCGICEASSTTIHVEFV